MKPNQINTTRMFKSFAPRSACLITLFSFQVVYGADVAVTDASSSGTGASITLSLVGVPAVNTGNLETSSGTAPGPYTKEKTGVPLNVNASAVLIDLVSANGVINTTASSTVDGTVASKVTAATSQVSNLSLNVADLPATIIDPPPLISLAVPVSSTAVTISGAGGSITSISNVSLTGMTLSVSGVSINLSSINLANVPANTAVNLGASAVAGLSVILNETTTVGTASGGYTTTTNAIRIKLNAVNVGLLNALDGDIIIGHAEAQHGADPDGDGHFSGSDGDGDGDGIADAIEIANAGAGGDTDGDGSPNHLDLDSDNDGINDVIEAGGKDTNNDGAQDASGDANRDEDGDGIVDLVDPQDDVAGGGKGAVLPMPDTDGDGRFNYVDLDSDNDGLSDLAESGKAPLSDADGVLKSGDSDGDGIDNLADDLVGYGDAAGSTGPVADTDNDGIPNSLETHSAGNQTTDISGTPYAPLDASLDGRIDINTDGDGDGIANVADLNLSEFGGLASPGGDPDGDGITNANEGLGLVDTDADGHADILDGDSDADGVPDLNEGATDFDTDGVANARDLDSDGDGINDVVEAGGKDIDGNAMQDPSGDANPDEDGDGMVDSVDPNDAVSGGGTGIALTRPDRDGDGARDFLDLDSDNDTIPDLVEAGLGATDINNNGIIDGADLDRDGLAVSADGLASAFGDAGGSTPIDTDGDGLPNYVDPDSDGAGMMDIATVGNGALDANGDGKVDDATDADGDGVPDVADNDDVNPGGLGFSLLTYAAWVIEQFAPPANLDPLVSGQDADPDHDGFSNAEEFAFGSDPETTSSIPSITITKPSGAGAAVQVSVVKNANAYAFVSAQASRDLGAWSSAPNIVTVNLDNPAQLSAQVSSSVGGGDTSKGFIRFRILIP